MASIIKDNFVKWDVNGGAVLGTVISVGESEAKVQVLNGSTVDKKLDTLVALSEDEWNTSVAEIISNLQNKQTKGAEMTVNANADTVAKLEAELKAKTEALTKAESELKAALEAAQSVKAEMDKMAKNADESKSALEASQKEASEAKTALAKIEADRKAEARLVELKGLNAVAAIDADEVKAKVKLGSMPDEMYATVLAMATGFKKLTDQTITALPKLTDQTISTQTQLTKAEDEKAAKEAADALAKAEADKEANLVAVAAANDKNPGEFAKAMDKLLVKEKKSK